MTLSRVFDCVEPSSLRSLHVTSSSPYGPFTVAKLHAQLQTIARTIASSCHTLHVINLYMWWGQNEEDCGVRTLLSSRSDWSDVSFMPVPGDMNTFRHLSQLTTLRFLDIRSSYTTPVDLNFISPGFRYLHKVTFRGPLPFCAALIHILAHPPLESLILELVKHRSEHFELADITSSLSAHLATPSLRTLHINKGTLGPHYEEDLDSVLAHFLVFPNLEDVSLHIDGQTWRLTQRLLFQIASAWPALRRLCLQPSVPISEGEGPENLPDIQSLETFALHNPKLQHLTVPVKRLDGVPEGNSTVQQLELRSLVIFHNGLPLHEVDTIARARLQAVFPSAVISLVSVLTKVKT